MSFGDQPVDKLGIRWETGQLCVNPGLECQGVVIRWVAPGPATVLINGKLNGVVKRGGKTTIRVCKDGNTLASSTVAGEGFVDAPIETPQGPPPAIAAIATSAELSTSISVNTGSVIDFIFAKGGELSGSHVGVDLTLQATGPGGAVSYSPSPLGTRSNSQVASAKAVSK